ncbi:hypothetical protein QGX11_gp095 [Pseudomonas phage PPSC2]|uniref:Uncharacterized protein n=1 Tax=Pseudomonas phage PPSC2 TaxID=2041350 RepID=A0A2R2YAQ9_9CAUD|nr:hypothetical protein QGX11_gp095 [Pseudomonas phage PPSC2]ATN92858.1 hypothetical protein PPSC2_95 [Pseudomonas phage PPSC2]
MDIIDVVTTHGHSTDLTVQPVSIHSGGMVICVITDKADGESIAVYDDEIDNLIAALVRAKEFLR